MSISREPFPPQPFTNDYSLQGDPGIGNGDHGSLGGGGGGGCDGYGGVCLNLVSQASAPQTSPAMPMASVRQALTTEGCADIPPPRFGIASSQPVYAHQVSESYAGISRIEPFSNLERNLVDNFYPASAPPDASHCLPGFNVSLPNKLFFIFL